MRKNRSIRKIEKKLFCGLLQDSSKSLEDKCVYTRLDVFTWITFASNTHGIIKNLQSGQCFQKIWSCVQNFLDSSKDSKIKSNYSRLHAFTKSKTSIQKNTREPILRKRVNGWVRFHPIQLVDVKTMLFLSSAIANVILKKKQALHKVHSSLWNGPLKERLANDKLAHGFLFDEDRLIMSSICSVPQIHVPKEH